MQTTRYSAVFALIAAVFSPMPIRGQQPPSAAPLRPVPITQLDLQQRHPVLDGRRVSLRPTRPGLYRLTVSSGGVRTRTYFRVR